ncbi:disulfide oxidoreductase [Aeribacillus sp. FSL K6-2848]|uniref:disulfide oxidoreductase n=1 Tax=Bacillales TaxID=1385 RepID=UPI0030C9396E
MKWSYQFGLNAAWIISIIATLGSLYFSEIKGFIPCELCWYQRIFMYPLTIILGIGIYNGHKKVHKYVLPLAIVGGIISTYHYLVQKIPNFGDFQQCIGGIPCHAEYVNLFGFITIPFMALIAFLSIIFILIISKKYL